MSSLLSNAPPLNRPASLLGTSLSTTFDPYTPATLHSRILALSATAGFVPVASITAGVFGARVLVPRSDIARGAPVTPLMTPTRAGLGFPGTGGGCGTSTTSLSVLGQPPQAPQQQQASPDTRAALGAAYIARWSNRTAGTYFEDKVRTIPRKRAKLIGTLGLTAGFGSYGRSGLGASVLVEEDEEKEEKEGEERERMPTNSTTPTSLSLHLSIPSNPISNPTRTQHKGVRCIINRRRRRIVRISQSRRGGYGRICCLRNVGSRVVPVERYAGPM